MTYNAALIDLLEHIALADRTAIVGWKYAQQWPNGFQKRLLSVDFLVKVSQAESIECTACGANACFKDIETVITAKPRAFIVCDDPEWQAEMGRINIPLEHLQQWKASKRQLAKVIADLLGLELTPDKAKHKTNIQLGMLPSKNGRHWASLNLDPLAFELNQHIAPLNEIIYFDGEELVVDRPRINRMLLAEPKLKGKKQTPSTTKREAGKRETEAMHQDWHDAYIRLQRQNPKKSARWISKQIEKMPIAQGRDSATIYRKMKG
jgi:hypothetical protein